MTEDNKELIKEIIDLIGFKERCIGMLEGEIQSLKEKVKKLSFN